MAATQPENAAQYKPVKTILVSQPKPERSPYFELQEKFGLTIDWRPFIHVEGLTAKEFRKQKVRIEDYSAIILTSKNAVVHFFRMAEEMRVRIDPDLKYFCLTENIAHYLQKFINYRKRKVFFGKRTIEDLATSFKRHKAKETFLLPCSNLGAKAVQSYLDANNVNYQDAMMYQTVSSDLSDLSDVTYDILVFFSPLGIQSLYDNFPDFKQNDTRLAVFGTTTSQAVLDRGLEINIKVPTPEAPSMAKALELYIAQANK